jgi:hypothetical protein
MQAAKFWEIISRAPPAQDHQIITAATASATPAPTRQQRHDQASGGGIGMVREPKQKRGGDQRGAEDV